MTPGLVLDRVVEPDDDVAAESAEGYHSPVVVADRFERLAVHRLLCVSLLVFGKLIDELTHCGTVVEYLGDIRRGFTSGRRFGAVVALAAGGRASGGEESRQGGGFPVDPCEMFHDSSNCLFIGCYSAC